MSEIKKEAVDTSSVENKEVKTPVSKNFSFNISAGEMNFVFTGPEGASIGTIYDVVHRLLIEVTNIAKARAKALAPKDASVNDLSKKEHTSVEDTEKDEAINKKD